MAIKGLEVSSIDAKRFAKSGERFANVRVDHNSTVTGIAAREGGISDVEFRFTVTYSGIGVIKLEGVLQYEGSPSLAATWSQSRKMPDDVAGEVHTAILTACIQEAVLLARELRLPPPIPLPSIQIKKGGEKSTGMEVA